MSEEERNELVQYRFNKAKNTLAEIDLHINNELWNTAVNRLYYACYYAVIALLIKNGIQSQTHAGTRQMSGLHFIKTQIIAQDLGKFYSRIFDMRHTSDYEDLTDFYKEDVTDLLNPAKELITVIHSLL